MLEYMRRYSYKKLYEWDPSLSYLSGLIAADGCLLNNGRHLNITSKDNEIIDLVQSILGMNVKVSVKASSYRGRANHLQFSNVALYDFLVEAGLTTAKSKTLGPINVPSEYYGDFLRGYFDGDGTIYENRDNRWNNSYMYYTGFVSASVTYLKWLHERNTAIAKVQGGSIKTNSRAFTLVYAKKDSHKLFNLMYYAPKLPALNRKREKFIQFIKTDPYANMVFDARVL